MTKSALSEQAAVRLQVSATRGMRIRFEPWSVEVAIEPEATYMLTQGGDLGAYMMMDIGVDTLWVYAPDNSSIGLQDSSGRALFSADLDSTTRPARPASPNLLLPGEIAPMLLLICLDSDAPRLVLEPEVTEFIAPGNWSWLIVRGEAPPTLRVDQTQIAILPAFGTRTDMRSFAATTSVESRAIVLHSEVTWRKADGGEFTADDGV